ncbi:hypothetical protein [Nocardia abscessus]|nr:hypothetical protein [Nocardia abscessus]
MTTVESHVIAEAADRLVISTATRTPCAPIHDLIGGRTSRPPI